MVGEPTRMARRSSPGTVYLVGAGPGNPDLITRRGASLLRKADCVLFDRLVPKELLRLTKRSCEKVDVGKESDEGGKSQGQIDRLLVQKAKRHRIVVRLKSGEPTLFGRISEELAALAKAKIPFEIVPGVSSLWAAAARAGIPLTDRKYSSSVAIVTGKQALGSPGVKWEALAKSVDTIAIVMGRKRWPLIVRRLLKGGLPKERPIALIRWATTPNEEILVSTLGKAVHDLKNRPHFGPPMVALIGNVIKRHKEFWPQPLRGKRVLITRPLGDGAGLAKRLQSLGADCIHLPTIAIRPRRFSFDEARVLLKELPRFDWVLFTSHHGVGTLKGLAQRVFKKTLPKLVKAKVCAIGPRTAQAVQEAGLSVNLLPTEFSTDGIQRAFRGIALSKKRILIPRSNLAVRDSLSKRLRQRGAVVEEVVMYETVKQKLSPTQVKKALKGLDVATFTSASTVEGFFGALKKARLSPRMAFDGARVVAIGPQTGQALKRSGIFTFTLPKESGTIDGLVKAVVASVRGNLTRRPSALEAAHA